MDGWMDVCMSAWMDGWMYVMYVMYAFLSAGAPDSAQPPGLWPSHADDTEIPVEVDQKLRVTLFSSRCCQILTRMVLEVWIC